MCVLVAQEEKLKTSETTIGKLNERIEETYRKMVKIRGELSEQVETSLGGIWNVVSNIEEKLYEQQKQKRRS